MSRRPATYLPARAAALLLALWAAPAWAAPTAEEAALCAAFSLGNHDYELARSDKDDASPGWLEQAEGFLALAIRLGMTEQAARAAAARDRAGMSSMIDAYIYGGDRASRDIFERLATRCGDLIESEPELAPYR